MENSIYFYNSRKLDKGITWLTFLLFGWSYGSMGKMGKQILFYLTLGGLGLWFLYVLFTLNSKIREFNKTQAVEAGITNEDLFRLGLA